MQKTKRDSRHKNRWNNLIIYLTDKFSETESINIEGVLYLIGLQELGQLDIRFKKDDNVNLIHVGICVVLEPYGFYKFDFYDEQGWPHFQLMEELPNLKSGEQIILIKVAIIEYFLKQDVIS